MVRFLLLVLLIALLGAWWMGYMPAFSPATATADGHESRPAINTDTARQRGAEVSERVAEGVNRVARGVDDAALTTKIKAKMALDDTVRARDINVDTVDGTVTLSGRVWSEPERQRVVQLAKETSGVRSVIDRLTMTTP
jgi:hyperosmotically inducible protein